MPPKEEALNINSPYLKLLGYMFVIGAAWTRLEYKMNESSERILKKIDEHIIADRFEKQIIDTRLTEIDKRIDNAAEYVDANTPKEFLRPSETRMETKKRKQF